MSSLDLSQLGNQTAFWPGKNLTAEFNDICYGNLTLCLNSEILCTLQTCDLSLAKYDYIPSLAGNALYAAIFGICIIGQLGLGIRFKTWGFMVAAVLGLVTEIIGYVGRIMAYSSPFDSNPFLIYLVCLTIAPAFLSAAIYLCLARIVVVYGEHISRFSPRTYTITFCTCDFFSLLLQAAGGGIAASANDQSTTQAGINTMLAGLSFQVFSLALFAAACAEFALRLHKNPTAWSQTHSALYSSRLFKAFLASLSVATLTIFVRSCFRVAELSGGFDGALANDQITFMVLEGMMIVIATLCLTVFHPGLCFRGLWRQANFQLKGRKADAEKGMESGSKST